MSRRRRKKGVTDSFDISAIRNDRSFLHYYEQLIGLAMSCFEWKNLPKSIDQRFLEMTLLSDGYAVFFKDDVMEEYLALQCMIGGRLDVYRIPVMRKAYAPNGYQKNLTIADSVIIFNNYTHTNTLPSIEQYAAKLWDIDRSIDVNARAQKTPILIRCSETQRLTMLNMYEQYDGNSPFIFADNAMNPNALSVLQTGAPYVADKLYELKTQVWNEALTFLGISNISVEKKERLITDEVNRFMGGVIASRNSRLDMRRQACEQINEMFGLDISVEFREDFKPEDEQGGGEMFEQVYDRGPLDSGA